MISDMFIFISTVSISNAAEMPLSGRVSVCIVAADGSFPLCTGEMNRL